MFVASAVLVVSYGAMAEFTAPVVRSVIMGLISAYSLVARRDYTSFHALALAVLAMTLYSPYLVYDLSFRLSCGASAGIVLLQPRVRQYLGGLPRFLCDGLAVCISAQLLLVPLLFSYFHSFPVYSFLANLTVGPVLDCTIVLGLAASVLGAACSFLAKPILALAGVLLALAVKANYFIAALPGSRFWSGAPPLFVSFAWYCGLTAVFSHRWRQGLAGVAAALVVCHYTYAFITKPDVSVYIFDMGNDRATCVVADDSSPSLWYNKSRWSNPEQVACVLTPALQHLGVFSLSHVHVSGHEQERTARQISDQFFVNNLSLGGTVSGIHEAVPAPIPYYIVGEFPTGSLPQQACLEIRSFDKLPRIPFPKESAVLILQRDRRSSPAWEDWWELADYYDIPAYSTHEGGEILAVRKGNDWKISYGGDS
jgi:competence protein ComEC